MKGHRPGNVVVVILALALAAAGCAPPAAPSTAPSPEGGSRQPAATKRITAAIIGEAQVLYLEIGAASNAPGDNAIEELVNTGLTELDDTGVSQAQLAQELPSLENGLWKVAPDGRMETTWRLRPNLRWHDGTPYTSADLVFTLGVMLDRELPMRRRPAHSAIDTIEAPDPGLVTVGWKTPFIEAHTLFSRELGLPLPRHLLERPAQEDKTGFANLPYWSSDFVGSGPFRLREYARGSHLLLQANDAYPLGRPKIDEIEIRFLSDPNVLVSNILAGEVDLFLGRGMNLERSIVLEEQWKAGRVEVRFSGLIVIYAQFLNPSPGVVTNVQFRRALLHVIDRQQMVDTLLSGRTSVAHVYLGPNEAAHKDVASAIIRYEYDPRRAATLFEGLGYSRGADGSLRDGQGQRLNVEVRSEPLETEQKALFASTDFLQQAGVRVEPLVIPRQRTADLEYRYTFPGLYLRGHASSLRTLIQYHGSQSPLPENRWSGNNRGRYVNPDLDGIIDRYFLTIPLEERNQVLRQMVHHLTDQVPVMPLFFNTEFTVIANRIQNMIATKAASGAAKTWHAHLWDTTT